MASCGPTWASDQSYTTLTEYRSFPDSIAPDVSRLPGAVERGKKAHWFVCELRATVAAACARGRVAFDFLATCDELLFSPLRLWPHRITQVMQRRRKFCFTSLLPLRATLGQVPEEENATEEIIKMAQAVIYL